MFAETQSTKQSTFELVYPCGFVFAPEFTRILNSPLDQNKSPPLEVSSWQALQANLQPGADNHTRSSSYFCPAGWRRVGMAWAMG